MPGSHAILFFSASDFPSITSHIYNWVLFSLWLHLLILSPEISGIISPVFSSSILGPYRPGEFIFQCPIFSPFHTVHGVLKARIRKGEKEKYKHLNAEFQRIARRDNKAFLSDQCKQIEENNRMERLEISSRKLEIPGNISCKDGLNKGQKWYGPNRSRRY